MLDVTPYGHHVAARLLDFFGAETPWQRRLWALGTVCAGREVLEASDAHQGGVLGEQSLRLAVEAFREAVKFDAGLPEGEKRATLACVDESQRRGNVLAAGGVPFRRLRQILDSVSPSYLERWAVAVGDPTPPKPERTARAIASHMLDQGFNGHFLHRWWKYRLYHQPGTQSLAEVINDAHGLANASPRRFEVLVVFHKAPQRLGDAPPEWRSSTQVASWLNQRNLDRSTVRQAGGLLLAVDALDAHAAVDAVADMIDRITSRVAVGTTYNLEMHDLAWVDGQDGVFRLRPDRRVEVHALKRAAEVFEVSSAPSKVDRGVELLAPLVQGPPVPAVSGAWAAVESVLSGPGDGAKVKAAERLAALVTCSFPRAELTRLAWTHQQHANDQLAAELTALPANRDKSKAMANALAQGQVSAQPNRESDAAAFDRMARLLRNPNAVLKDVRSHVARTVRRLYRQRNLVLHAGLTEAVALRPTLRTASPLVGAGFDRIAHAWLVDRVDPLDLAARAENRLVLVGTSDGVSPLELLD